MVKNPLANAKDTVQSLIWEDFMCHGAISPRTSTTEPMLQSPGAAATEGCTS